MWFSECDDSNKMLPIPIDLVVESITMLNGLFAFERSQWLACRRHVTPEFAKLDDLKRNWDCRIPLLGHLYWVLLTFIVLLHKRQVHLLQTMEVFDAGAVISHTRDVAQCQESLSGKVVGGENIVIHHSECNHRSFDQALLKRHRKFKAFVKVGVQSFL